MQNWALYRQAGSQHDYLSQRENPGCWAADPGQDFHFTSTYSVLSNNLCPHLASADREGDAHTHTDILMEKCFVH